MNLLTQFKVTPYLASIGVSNPHLPLLTCFSLYFKNNNYVKYFFHQIKDIYYDCLMQKGHNRVNKRVTAEPSPTHTARPTR